MHKIPGLLSFHAQNTKSFKFLCINYYLQVTLKLLQVLVKFELTSYCFVDPVNIRTRSIISIETDLGETSSKLKTDTLV